jgi:hypothetical protein
VVTRIGGVDISPDAADALRTLPKRRAPIDAGLIRSVVFGRDATKTGAAQSR